MKHDNFFNIGFNDLNYFKKLQGLLNDVWKNLKKFIKIRNMNEEIMDTIGYDTAIDGKLVYWFDFCVFLIITFL